MLAVAEEARQLAGAGDQPLTVLALLDARMDEVYSAAYDWDGQPALEDLPMINLAIGCGRLEVRTLKEKTAAGESKGQVVDFPGGDEARYREALRLARELVEEFTAELNDMLAADPGYDGPAWNDWERAQDLYNQAAELLGEPIWGDDPSHPAVVGTMAKSTRTSRSTKAADLRLEDLIRSAFAGKAEGEALIAEHDRLADEMDGLHSGDLDDDGKDRVTDIVSRMEDIEAELAGMLSRA